MKLSDYLNSYYAHTGNASTVSRQASFAGIALVWVFNTKSGNEITLPIDLLMPVLWLVISLGLDLLQYISSAFIWGVFHRVKEKQLGANAMLKLLPLRI